MKIKRFVAKDIRQAMRMVKQELGVDAVIMSNRSVEEGVEIVAAKDFDEQVVQSRLHSQENSVGFPEKHVSHSKLSDFEAKKNNLHLLSSSRKIGVDGVVPKKSLNHNVDEYVGYAEKVNLVKQASSATKSNALPIQKTGINAKQFNHDVVKEAGTQQSNIAAFKFMQEMRKDIKLLKSALDSKLSELSWNQGVQNNPVRLDLLHRLAAMGFSKKLSFKVANRLDNHKEINPAFSKAKEMLAKVLPIYDDNLLEHGGVIALVGPTGVGKTTTIAKLAAQFILKHGANQVALITTDNYRIGAHEQLTTYGQLLDVPVRTATNAQELRQHINSFNDKRLILIDTAGMSQRDMRLAEQIRTLKQDDIAIKTYLVMSAATQYKAVVEIINAYKVFQPESSILTKLDETAVQGSILSAVIEQQLPVSFITNGQQVPEDILIADAYSLIEECAVGLDQENDFSRVLSYDEWIAEGYA